MFVLLSKVYNNSLLLLFDGVAHSSFTFSFSTPPQDIIPSFPQALLILLASVLTTWPITTDGGRSNRQQRRAGKNKNSKKQNVVMLSNNVHWINLLVTISTLTLKTRRRKLVSLVIRIMEPRTSATIRKHR